MLYVFVVRACVGFVVVIDVNVSYVGVQHNADVYEVVVCDLYF